MHKIIIGLAALSIIGCGVYTISNNTHQSINPAVTTTAVSDQPVYNDRMNQDKLSTTSTPVTDEPSATEPAAVTPTETTPPVVTTPETEPKQGVPIGFDTEVHDISPPGQAGSITTQLFSN